MTSLNKLRRFVGLRGNWDKFGICSLPFVQDRYGFVKTYLVCENSRVNVFESAYPDITDVIEQISEARASVILNYLTTPRDVETAVMS